ncbi:MAG TPA: CYTH domain-containing protein [Solirubrobacteraceae bacterium]|nr:CYTH domain-containing protein [Solirubrobacteraceae bacterium]
MSEPPGVEIERKFLVTRVPDPLPPGDRLEQGYLAVAPDGTEVRIRRRAGRSTLTVKSGPAHVRVEEEIEIDDRRFEALWALTEGRRIAKTRHLVPLGDDLTAELDVYAEALDGLLVAEVEFASTEASRAFAPPDWLGAELTGDARYANQSLALHGAPPR